MLQEQEGWKRRPGTLVLRSSVAMYLLLSALAKPNLILSEQSEGVGGRGGALINTRDSAFPVFSPRTSLAPEHSKVLPVRLRVKRIMN